VPWAHGLVCAEGGAKGGGAVPVSQAHNRRDADGNAVYDHQLVRTDASSQTLHKVCQRQRPPLLPTSPRWLTLALQFLQRTTKTQAHDRSFSQAAKPDTQDAGEAIDLRCEASASPSPTAIGDNEPEDWLGESRAEENPAGQTRHGRLEGRQDHAPAERRSLRGPLRHPTDLPALPEGDDGCPCPTAGGPRDVAVDGISFELDEDMASFRRGGKRRDPSSADSSGRDAEPLRKRTPLSRAGSTSSSRLGALEETTASPDSLVEEESLAPSSSMTLVSTGEGAGPGFDTLHSQTSVVLTAKDAQRARQAMWVPSLPDRQRGFIGLRGGSLTSAPALGPCWCATVLGNAG
jgi:hypothetical protein